MDVLKKGLAFVDAYGKTFMYLRHVVAKILVDDVREIWKVFGRISD